ncbi:MAG: PilT protein [uncultured bacterium]|uniref:PIN domain-containing protein n=1 Tax=candidate division WWE3 bacterium RBG_16_37_10 TaxID=1802610 RepID=A0A1F4V2R6_UNCKA|nr:MAG: PilT protein [uncultured bacterium]OGC51494.1 MAG: hypothetical protein A2W32_02535 [candidate division WWE3 bacterium RBG_16_37_10]
MIALQNNIPFIDTNVFLRYLVYDKVNPGLSKKAKKVFEGLITGNLTVQTNILVISEIFFVLHKFYGLAVGEVVEKISLLLNLENIIMEDKGKIIAALFLCETKNVDFEDAYLYVDMLSCECSSIYTFDKKHFSRFDDINILDF